MGRTASRDSVRRGATRAVFTVGLLNALFLGLLLGARVLPPRPLVARIVEAFQRGDLIDDDFPQFDARRGAHQFTDCEILQMIVSRTDSIWVDAVGPLLENPGGTTSQCAALRRIVTDGPDPATYGTWRYARYWHGYVPVAAAFLLGADLATVRRVLKVALYGALGLLAVAVGLRHLGLAAVTWTVSVAGTLFWAVPYFGQTLTHAPGDIAAIIGLGALLAFRRKLTDFSTLIPFCAGYGALLAYLDFLTGVLPTGAALLGPLAYLCAASELGRDARRTQAWMRAAAGLTAFAFGAAVTVAAKQALAAIVLGPSALRAFVQALSIRLGPADEAGVFAPLMELARRSDGLTYGSRSGALALLATGGLAWALAACLAVSRRDRRAVSDLLAFSLGPIVVVAWSLALPNHTADHGWFMVRMVMAPIALGVAAVWWQLLASKSWPRTSRP